MSNPFRWTPSTLMKTVRRWLLNLEDFPEALSVVRKLDTTGPSWLQYGDVLQRNGPGSWCEKSASLVQRIHRLLFYDTGIAVLSCGRTLTGNQARLVELLVGTTLGENVTRTPGKTERPLFQATLSLDPTAGNHYVGNALKQHSIGLHTDGSGTIDRKVEILQSLYVSPARFGGQSIVANAQLAFESLPEKTRRILQRSFPRQSPYKDGSVPRDLLCMPIFKKVGRGSNVHMEFSYHPARIRNGAKLARTTDTELKDAEYDPEQISEKLTNEERVALGELDEALKKASCEITLMQNEILIVNNQIVPHDRRPFFDDPRAPRLMERFWAGQFRSVESLHRVGRASCSLCGS